MADLKAGKPTGKKPVKRVQAPAPVIKAAPASSVAPAVAAKIKVSPPVSVAPASRVIPKVAASSVPAPKAPVAVSVPKPIPAPEPIVEAAKTAAEMPVEGVETVKDVAEVGVEKTAAAVETVETVTNPAAQPLDKGLFAMADKITAQSFVPTPENVQALFGDFSSRTKAAVEKSAKMAEEFGEFAKGNVEALVTSGRVAAKGAETLGQGVADYGKKSIESATTAVKSFAAAKSPTELFKLQSDYARSAFDAAVAEGSKFSESLLKLFGEIAQPISSRVAVAAEKIKTPAF